MLAQQLGDFVHIYDKVELISRCFPCVFLPRATLLYSEISVKSTHTC